MSADHFRGVGRDVIENMSPNVCARPLALEKVRALRKLLLAANDAFCLGEDPIPEISCGLSNSQHASGILVAPPVEDFVRPAGLVTLFLG